MKKLTYFISLLAAITLYWCLGKSTAIASYPQQTSPVTQTKLIVAAANDFLNSLSAEQLNTTQFEFLRPNVASPTQFNMANMRRGAGGPPNGQKPANGDTTQRRANQRPAGGNGQPGGQPSSGEQYGKALWSNFPVSITPRPGIELGSLNAKQRAAATHLLQVALSATGYEKVQEIMGSDQALADGGTDFVAGKDHYLIGIYGTPNNTKPWMIEFGGHHLGLNVVIAGPRGALTPTLTGAQPAVYTANGKTVRVLAQENDKAFTLLNALNADQRKKAILNYHIGDLVVGPGHDGQTIVPEGLKGSEMTVQQRELMLSLMEEWAGIINNAYQKTRVADLRADLNETYFAWSGPTTHAQGRNGTAYYRIQGPKVIIEFAPQATMGDLDNHVHTIYRDPTNEYGAAYATR
jgi:hypothetical protein